MHDRTMFCLVDACTVRSSPKVSIMIPKMTLRRMVITTAQKESW